jgi:hypothetical protein
VARDEIIITQHLSSAVPSSYMTKLSSLIIMIRVVCLAIWHPKPHTFPFHSIPKPNPILVEKKRKVKSKRSSSSLSQLNPPISSSGKTAQASFARPVFDQFTVLSMVFSWFGLSVGKGSLATDASFHSVRERVFILVLSFTYLESLC